MNTKLNTRPKLFPPLALLNAPRSQPAAPQGNLSPLELRRIVADLLG